MTACFRCGGEEVNDKDKIKTVSVFNPQLNKTTQNSTSITSVYLFNAWISSQISISRVFSAGLRSAVMHEFKRSQTRDSFCQDHDFT